LSPLRFGILGAAKIADKYSVAAMHAVESVLPVAVGARDSSRGADFAARHSIEYRGSYADVVASPDLDAIYIPLPTSFHAEWAVAALRAGKHVLCEKSLSGNLASVMSVVELARERGLLVVENFMCEKHPQNQTVRALLEEGGLGQTRQSSLSFGFPAFPPEDQRNSAELQGGALNDAGAYCVDMASFYARATPRRISAVLDTLGTEVDQVGAAQLTFEGGQVAQLAWGFQHDYRNEARIWGTSGQIDIDRAFSIPPDRTPSVRITRNTASSQLELPAANHFEQQFDDFASRVASGSVTRALDAVEAQAVTMDAVRRSAAQQRTVDLTEEFSAEDLRRFDASRAV
jgi:NDP-hexose-3-ketoreductase